MLEGETITISTESQSFPRIAGVSQIDVIGNGSGAAYPSSLTVTDGVFEFSKLIVEPGGRLIFEGDNPARVLVRGSCVIGPNSIVDLSGTSPGEHDSLILAPQMGDVTAAAGGPGGGAGGLGGDRSDLGSAVPNFLNLSLEDAVVNPGANRDGLAARRRRWRDRRRQRGDRFPATLPTDITVQSDSIQNTLGDTGFNVFGDPLLPTDGDRCILQMVAGPGAGGAYALDGGRGAALPSASLTETPPAFRSSLRPPLAARTQPRSGPAGPGQQRLHAPSLALAGRQPSGRLRRRWWGQPSLRLACDLSERRQPEPDPGPVPHRLRLVPVLQLRPLARPQWGPGWRRRRRRGVHDGPDLRTRRHDRPLRR